MCTGLNPQYKTEKLKCFPSTQKEACHVGQLDIYNHASNFFVSWCSYSVKNIPNIELLKHESGFQFLYSEVQEITNNLNS